MVGGHDPGEGGWFTRFRTIVSSFIGNLFNSTKPDQDLDSQRDVQSNGGDNHPEDYREPRSRGHDENNSKRVRDHMDESDHDSETESATGDTPTKDSEEHGEKASVDEPSEQDGEAESHSTTDKSKQNPRENSGIDEEDTFKKNSSDDEPAGSSSSVTEAADQTSSSTAHNDPNDTLTANDDNRSANSGTSGTPSACSSTNASDPDGADGSKEPNKGQSQSEEPARRAFKSRRGDAVEVDQASAIRDDNEALDAAIRRIDSPDAELIEPINSVPLSGLLPRSRYITELEEHVRVLEATVDERDAIIKDQQETIADLKSRVSELETTEPELESIQQDEVPTGEYVSMLETHIGDLDSKIDRKNRVIEELKDELDEAETETYQETVREVISEFVSDVRAPLNRGLKQGGGGTEGVGIIIDQFDDLVADYDLSLVDPSPGDPVDRNRVEVSQIVTSEYEEGTVAKVYERGLEDDGSIIKHAAVAMSEGNPDDETGSDAVDKNQDEPVSDRKKSDTSNGSLDSEPGKTTDIESKEMIAGEDDLTDTDTHNAEDEAQDKPTESGYTTELNLSVISEQIRVGKPVRFLVTDAENNPLNSVMLKTNSGKQVQTNQQGRAAFVFESEGSVSVQAKIQDTVVDTVTVEIDPD
jgi:molecular chaperone GrpE (heat shock protein)